MRFEKRAKEDQVAKRVTSGNVAARLRDLRRAIEEETAERILNAAERVLDAKSYDKLLSALAGDRVS